MDRRQEVLNRFEFLSYLFDPQAVPADICIQFHITDHPAESPCVSFYFQTDGDRCEMIVGEHHHPDTTITVPYSYWTNLQAKNIGKLQVFRDMMHGDPLQVDGNRRLFLQFTKIFGGTLENRYLRPDDVVLKEPSATANTQWRAPRSVVILSGSGRNKREATSYHFARFFAKGLSQSAPEPKIHLIHLRDFDFKECEGCLYCFKNGGRCKRKDDYASIIRPLIDKCELLILAFPLYFYGLPPQINNAITRFMTNNHPLFRKSTHVSDLTHYDRRPYPFSLFLLGTGGGFDTEQFQVPVKRMQIFSRRHEIPYLGSIFRATGNSFLIPAARTPRLNDIEEGFTQAGFELASTGKVSPKTTHTVEQNILTPALLRSAGWSWYHLLNKKFKYPHTHQLGEISEFDIRKDATSSWPKTTRIRRTS